MSALIVVVALVTSACFDMDSKSTDSISAGIIPIDPVDVSLNRAWRFQNVDCSSFVPEGAEGVILDIEGTAYKKMNAYTVRKKGSSDLFAGRLGDYCHTVVAIGVDENRIFEARVSNLNIKMWVVAYIPEGTGTFLTNAQDVSLDTLETWMDIDISPYTGSETSKIAFLLVNCKAAEFDAYDLRENGSTDDREKVCISKSALRGAMVGLDDNETFEGWIDGLNIDFYLVGWLNVGYAETFPNAIEYSTGEEAGWIETEFLELPEGATGAFLTFYNPNPPDEYLCAFRPDGSMFDNFYCIRHIQHFWCAVTDRVMEQKIWCIEDYEPFREEPNPNLWLWGYTGGTETTYYKETRFSLEELRLSFFIPFLGWGRKVLEAELMRVGWCGKNNNG